MLRTINSVAGSDVFGQIYTLANFDLPSEVATPVQLAMTSTNTGVPQIADLPTSMPINGTVYTTNPIGAWNTGAGDFTANTGSLFTDRLLAANTFTHTSTVVEWVMNSIKNIGTPYLYLSDGTNTSIATVLVLEPFKLLRVQLYHDNSSDLSGVFQELAVCDNWVKESPATRDYIFCALLTTRSTNRVINGVTYTPDAFITNFSSARLSKYLPYVRTSITASDWWVHGIPFIRTTLANAPVTTPPLFNSSGARYIFDLPGRVASRAMQDSYFKGYYPKMATLNVSGGTALNTQSNLDGAVSYRPLFPRESRYTFTPSSLKPAYMDSDIPDD